MTVIPLGERDLVRVRALDDVDVRVAHLVQSFHEGEHQHRVGGDAVVIAPGEHGSVGLDRDFQIAALFAQRFSHRFEFRLQAGHIQDLVEKRDLVPAVEVPESDFHGHGLRLRYECIFCREITVSADMEPFSTSP
jgi:hypothetical protein